MEFKFHVTQIILILAFAQYSSASNYRQKRSFPWPSFLGGGSANSAQELEPPSKNIAVPTQIQQIQSVEPVATNQRVHYPIWRIHKYHGVDLKPVPISLMRHDPHIPTNGGVQQSQIVYQQPQSQSKIPYELLDLAKTFGVTDIKNLPSLDEAQNLLGASSREETISIIRELAETADGRELIRNFLKQNEVTSDDESAQETIQIDTQQQPTNLQHEQYGVPFVYSQSPVVAHEQYGVPIDSRNERQSWHHHQPIVQQNPNLSILPIESESTPTTTVKPAAASGFFGTIGQWTNYFTPSLGLSASSAAAPASSSSSNDAKQSEIPVSPSWTTTYNTLPQPTYYAPAASSSSNDAKQSETAPISPSWTTYTLPQQTYYAPPQQPFNNQKDTSDTYPWYAPAVPPLLPSFTSSSFAAADKSEPQYPPAIQESSSSDSDSNKGPLYPPVSSDDSQSIAQYPAFTSGDSSQNISYQTAYGVVPNSETIPIPRTPQFDMSQQELATGLQLPALPELPEVHIPKQFLLPPINAAAADASASESDINSAGTYIRVRYPTSDFNPAPEMPTFLPGTELNQFRNSETVVSADGPSSADGQQQQFVYNEDAPAELLPSIGEFPLANYEIYRSDKDLKNSYGAAAIPYLFPDDEALELVSDDNVNAAASEYESQRLLSNDHQSAAQQYSYSNDNDDDDNNDRDIIRRSDSASPQRISAYDTYATGKINRANLDAVRSMIPTQKPIIDNDDDGQSIIDAIATKTSDGFATSDQ